jgi:hypothetical protein
VLIIGGIVAFVVIRKRKSIRSVAPAAAPVHRPQSTARWAARSRSMRWAPTTISAAFR